MQRKSVSLAIGGNFAIQKTITPESSRETLNGAAYYAVVGASLFSLQGTIGVWTRIGKPERGEDRHISSLNSRGIDTRGVVEVTGGKTPVFVFTYDKKGTRTFQAEMGLAASVDLSIFPAAYESARHIHFATNDPSHYLQWIKELRPRIPKANFSIDLFEEYVRTKSQETVIAIQESGLVFLNKEEYDALSPEGQTILTQTPYVLKNGAAGAAYIDEQKGIRYRAFAPKISAVDTTGAGDILAGAFLAQRVKGEAIPVSLQNAVNTASESVTKFGVEHLKQPF